jgi:DNA polymerase-1
LLNTLVIDIETDGLDYNRIHCLVTLDVDNNIVKTFLNPVGVREYFNSFDKIVAHNGSTFDFPALRKLWGVTVPVAKQTDSLILSRMAKPDREKGHGLKAWGERLGFHKGSYEESWEQLTDEMIAYCEQDVLLCAKVYGIVCEETKDFSEKAITDEHRMQRLASHVEENGFAFDKKLAHKMYSKLLLEQEEIVVQMQDTFEPEVIQLKTKTKLKPFNPASRKQIGERLIEKGWKPRGFTPTGQPKVDESTLEDCSIPEAQILARYFMLQKRTAMIDSWLKSCGEADRVHCHYRTLGAITNRMSCSNPNLQQIPSLRKPFGLECRQMWKSDYGNVLIDTDAAGLELRVLAHYMDDAEYTTEILNGDIHTANQNMAGLDTRDQAKTFIYALLYGAGDAKIGSVVNGTAKDGKALRERFLSNLPSFSRLREAVVHKGTTEGRLRAIDGRQLVVRHPHASINTLIQGSSAVLMKKWFMNTAATMKARKTGAKLVAMVHDEMVIECGKESIDSVSDCVKIAISQVNQEYNLRCKLDCDVQIGNNWSEIH